MSRRKTSGRPTGKRSKPNMVEAAVALCGGPVAVAKLCGVKRQTVYLWIKEWRVDRLGDALRLSHASGIPIEKLAGEGFDPSKPAKDSSGKRTKTDFQG
jgi:transposase-like protein